MEISHKQNDSRKVEEHQDTTEEIVRKSRKSKYIASQKIEEGETSVERHERMPLQMLQKRQKVFTRCSQETLLDKADRDPKYNKGLTNALVI
nr:hypothetical protein CFP56_62818 [Quercus suber]